LANPKSEALAFRIWAYAEPLGWDCTVKDIAEELGESWQRVSRVCVLKGWASRLRNAAITEEDYFAAINGKRPARNHFASYADALKYSEHLL